ncbi:hypothetical protein JTB14_034919 [Gonioctena quinquepunctata]|nr:hypothetical protein JTB14_034919 [Gonioctena quinquepunctata]
MVSSVVQMSITSIIQLKIYHYPMNVVKVGHIAYNKKLQKAEKYSKKGFRINKENEVEKLENGYASETYETEQTAVVNVSLDEMRRINRLQYVVKSPSILRQKKTIFKLLYGRNLVTRNNTIRLSKQYIP